MLVGRVNIRVGATICAVDFKMHGMLLGHRAWGVLGSKLEAAAILENAAVISTSEALNSVSLSLQLI